MSAKNNLGAVIHGAAMAAGAVGAGLAQIPCSDNAVITPIQVGMILAIGRIVGKDLDRASALSVLSAASAGIVGRTISQILIGWIPGYGNVTNASTAFAVTEAIGWASYRILCEDG